MSECFEKKSLIKFEHVDIGHELEKRGMLDMWPTEVLEHRLLRVNTFILFCKRGLAPVACSRQTRGYAEKAEEARATKCVRMRGSQGVRDLINAVRSRNTAHIIFCARWLPPVCSQAKVIRPDGTEGGNTSKLRLDLCQWQLAWDRHMIGAIVVGQVGRFTCLFSGFV